MAAGLGRRHQSSAAPRRRGPAPPRKREPLMDVRALVGVCQSSNRRKWPKRGGGEKKSDKVRLGKPHPPSPVLHVRERSSSCWPADRAPRGRLSAPETASSVRTTAPPAQSAPRPASAVLPPSRLRHVCGCFRVFASMREIHPNSVVGIGGLRLNQGVGCNRWPISARCGYPPPNHHLLTPGTCVPWRLNTGAGGDNGIAKM
jgi:hypothetical protein